MKQKYLLTLCLLICSFFGTAHAQLSRLAEARELRANKKYDDAIAISLRALDQDSTNYRANWLCATGYLNINIYSEAERYYKRLIRLHPSEAAFSNLGGLYGSFGYDKRAMKAIEKALEFDPDYKAAIGNRAGVHAYHYRIDEALKDFNYVIDNYDAEVNDYLNLAVIYDDVDDYANSSIWIKKALESDSKRADVVLFSERLKKSIDPSYQFSKPKIKEAIKQLTEKIKENSYDAYNVYQRARAYQDLGENELAKTDFTKALLMYDDIIEDVPDAWRKRYVRARIYAELGDTQNAIAENERILEMNPKEKTVIKRLEKLRHTK